MSISKSIEQLENDIRQLCSEYPSEVIRKSIEYRKIPIQYLTIEQLRFLLVQNMGVKFLITRVIHKLQNNILAEGDLYKGDLLCSIANISKKYWLNFKSELNTLIILVKTSKSTLKKELGEKEYSKILEKLNV